MALVIDAQIAGISGDMMLCSLVHMGADESKIVSALRRTASKVPQTKLDDIGFERVKRHGLEATALRIEISQDTHSCDASKLDQYIVEAAKSENLSAQAKEFAASAISTLITAESKVHGVPYSSVHLHEAASFDTVVDIVGTAIALDNLDLFSERITCTPVAVGGGLFEFSHGTASNPAGAILEILCGKNIEICGGPINSELTTPTGASILVNLASACERFYQPISPTMIGYGAGSTEHAGFANVLKLVRGNAASSLSTDTVKVLETNLDDVTGELLSHVIDALMKHGARDVTVSPGVTKKGRPTSLVTVICDTHSYDAVLSTLINETGTLGVRVRDSARVIAQRDSKTAELTIEGKQFKVRYKTSNAQTLKMEHDDVARVASELNVPLRHAQRLLDDAISGELH